MSLCFGIESAQSLADSSPFNKKWRQSKESELRKLLWIFRWFSTVQQNTPYLTTTGGNNAQQSKISLNKKKFFTTFYAIRKKLEDIEHNGALGDGSIQLKDIFWLVCTVYNLKAYSVGSLILAYILNVNTHQYLLIYYIWWTLGMNWSPGALCSHHLNSPITLSY